MKPKIYEIRVSMVVYAFGEEDDEPSEYQIAMAVHDEINNGAGVPREELEWKEITELKNVDFDWKNCCPWPLSAYMGRKYKDFTVKQLLNLSEKD